MVRWIAWFALGPLLLVLGALGLAAKADAGRALVLVVGPLLWLWAFVTFWAVIIKLIAWLVRGRRADVPPST